MAHTHVKVPGPNFEIVIPIKWVYMRSKFWMILFHEIGHLVDMRNAPVDLETMNVFKVIGYEGDHEARKLGAQELAKWLPQIAKNGTDPIGFAEVYKDQFEQVLNPVEFASATIKKQKPAAPTAFGQEGGE